VLVFLNFILSSIFNLQSTNFSDQSAAHTANLPIEDSKVVISNAENLTEYRDSNTASGTTISRFFCRTCGNAIKTVSPSYPGMMFLKLGIFAEIPAPTAEIYAGKRQAWDRGWDGCKAFETDPNSKELS
jgi:hypothetical protein